MEVTDCRHWITPWGIFRYKRMVMGTSPASSEIQKKIHDTITQCANAIHIKDDILVHGTGTTHDDELRNVLQTIKTSWPDDDHKK